MLGWVVGGVGTFVVSLAFACVFLQPLITYLAGVPRPEGDASLEHMRRFGPVGLFAYCAMTLLFSTGYSVDALPESFRGRPALQKPFRIDTLQSAIDEVLRNSSERH